MGPALSAATAGLDRDGARPGRAFPERHGARHAVPRALVHLDRPLMLGAVLGLAGALALTGLAAAWLARPSKPAGPVVVSVLAPRPMVLPAAWFVRPGAGAETGGDRIDLAIPWSELTGSALPGLMRVTATRSPETEAPLSPARRYARFLTAEAQPLPEGLMRRRFRAGTPFEGEDLYLAEGGRFAARCATGPSPEPEAACLSEVRIGALNLRLRFAAERLPSWSAGLAGLERLFGSEP